MPSNRLPASLPERVIYGVLALLIGLTTLLYSDPRTVFAAAPVPPGIETPAIQSTKTTEQPSSDGSPDAGEDVQSLKQRYPHDPTGVRARLCMCRRGEQGHDGRRHRFHGGQRWNQP